MSSARVRVCHVITRLELGGAQLNTLYTVSRLDRRRFEPALIAGRGGLLDDDARRIPDVPVTLIPSLVREVSPARDAVALLALTRRLRRLAPDVVHTHSSKAGILGRWAARLAGVPAIVHTIHGYGFHAGQSPRTHRLFRALEAATSRITTRFVAVSAADIRRGLEHGLFAADRVALIRSGIPLRGMAGESALRAELRLPPHTPLAGMVACLKPQKAPLDFVRVAARVAARVPAARFVLVGDGELRPAVEAEIARLGLGGRLHMLGWRRDVPAILRALDVVVLTSLWEGLPRVIPEAMAAARPVVATAVDGVPEAVADGVTGYLVRPHDVDAAAERVAGLLDDPVNARRLGEQARGRVAEFDIDEMVRRQEALYEELMASPVPEPATV